MVAQVPNRPSDLVGYEGSPVERLLFDIEVITQSPVFSWSLAEPQSTKERIRRRRKELGIV